MSYTVIDASGVIKNDGEKEATKLTDWKSEPTYQDLKADLDLAIQDNSLQAGKVREWLDCLNVKGDYAGPNVPGRSRVAPRLVRKQTEWRCPGLTEPLLNRTKLFDVKPVTFEDVRAAEQNELLLNYQFKQKIKFRHFIDTLVRTAVTEGTAILRTGWEFKEKEITEEEPIWENTIDPSVIQEYQYIQQMVQKDPSFMQTVSEQTKMGMQLSNEYQQPIRVVQSGVKPVKKTIVTANHPTVEICDIESIYVDPTCKGDLDKAKFLVYSFKTCMADLKEDSRYSNLDMINEQLATQPHTTAGSGSEVSNRNFSDDPRRELIAYEYWGYRDIHGTGILSSVVATFEGNTIIYMDENPYPDGKFPFIFIPLIPVKNSLYGEPDAELLGDNQKIIGAITRGAIDLLGRSANGQTGFAKNFLDATNFKRFRAGEDYYFNPTAVPDAAIHTHKFPEIPQSALTMLQYTHNDSESLTGIRAFTGSNGIPTTTGSVNEGVRNYMDATTKRETSILRRFADGLCQVARKFIAMNAEFLDETEVVRLTNKEFVQIRRDDLAGQFDLELEISTAEEDHAKAEELAFLLQTGQGSFPFQFTQKILTKMAKLRNMPDLAQFIETYEPEPDPKAEMAKELELAKMKAEIAEREAAAAESYAKKAVHEAEVQVRLARASDIRSNADQKNLDFMRTAEGIKHQEDLEKAQAQAEANIQSQQAAHQNSMEQKMFEHNSELLRNHATQAITPKTPASSA
jgi:hypothetical protein